MITGPTPSVTNGGPTVAEPRRSDPAGVRVTASHSDTAVGRGATGRPAGVAGNHAPDLRSPVPGRFGPSRRSTVTRYSTALMQAATGAAGNRGSELRVTPPTGGYPSRRASPASEPPNSATAAATRATRIGAQAAALCADARPRLQAAGQTQKRTCVQPDLQRSGSTRGCPRASTCPVHPVRRPRRRGAAGLP